MPIAGRSPALNETLPVCHERHRDANGSDLVGIGPVSFLVLAEVRFATKPTREPRASWFGETWEVK